MIIVMKVCLAALIPLLAFLIVLPSDVSARRRIRQKLERKEECVYPDISFKYSFKFDNLTDNNAQSDGYSN